MIRRRDGDSFLLIPQVEHARLSGRLARRVGNELFTRPSPFEQVVLAIENHDAGWDPRDRQPELNLKGLPRHVFETDLADTSIFDTWDKSVELAEQFGPDAALLVSLHGLSLVAFATGKRNALNVPAMRKAVFQANKFQHRQIERQESYRRKLGLVVDRPLHMGLAEPGRSVPEDLLLRNFRLLQMLDQLSLVLCFDQPIFTAVESVYREPGGQPTTVQFIQEAPYGWRVDPWPFDQPTLEFAVWARRVPVTPFASQQDLVLAYQSAPEDQVVVKLLP